MLCFQTNSHLFCEYVKNALRKEETNSSRDTLIISAASEETWLLRRRQQDWSVCSHEQAWTADCFLNTMTVSCSGIPFLHPSCWYLVHHWAWWPCCALCGIWARKVELLTQLSLLLHWSITRPFWRWNGFVCIATRLQGGQLKSRGSNGTGGKRLFPSPKRPHFFWGQSTLTFSRYLGLFPQERNGHLVNLTTHLCLWPVTNEWSCNFTPPCSFMVCIGATLPSRLRVTCFEPRCVGSRVREEEMQEDMKRQEGENCRKAGDILVAVFKLLRSFVIDIDPVWVFWCMALGCVLDVPKEVAVNFFLQCGHLFRCTTE